MQRQLVCSEDRQRNTVGQIIGDDPHERDENAMPPILDVLDGGREWRGGCEEIGQSGCYGKQSFAREAGAI